MLNNDDRLPEMQRLAEYLGECLRLYRSDAAVEYPEAGAFADGLARPKGRILLGH